MAYLTSREKGYITSYKFGVLDSNGMSCGTGCFTVEGSGATSIQHRRDKTPSDGPILTAFWYRDPVVGVLDISSLLNLGFSDVEGSQQFHFNAWTLPDYSCGLVTGIATPQHPGTISAHRGAAEDVSCRGRLLAWPALAEPTVETIEEDKPIVPLVDQVAVIDSIASMKDGAVALNAAIAQPVAGTAGLCTRGSAIGPHLL